MSDIRQLAAQRRADYERRTAEEHDRAAVREGERIVRVTDAINKLRTVAKPILLNAGRDLDAEKIYGTLTESFETEAWSDPPHLVMGLEGPARASDGYRFKTPRLTIMYLDGEFTAHMAAPHQAARLGEKIGRGGAEDLPALVSTGVEMMLDDYFKKLSSGSTF